jgi:hypothetical protein
MCVHMVRSNVNAKQLSEVEAAIEQAFSAIAAAHPEGGRQAREMTDRTGQESRSIGPRAVASMTSSRYVRRSM